MTELVNDFEEGLIIGECQNFARLLHGPGMFITPEKFVELVKQKLSIYSKITIIERDETWLEMNNMNSVLHVSKINVKGNSEGIASKYLNDSAQLLEIHYDGSGASIPPIVFVGKASFYSLFDDGKALETSLNKLVPDVSLSAGASIIGTLLAFCRLKSTINAKGIIPITVHSLHVSKAILPNFLDEVTPSIQIPHPVEERMLLKDSITYAHSFCPDFIISVATQTSYVTTAFDSSTSVFYSSQDALAELFSEICSYTCEKFIRLPFVEIEDSVFHKCVIQKQCCSTCINLFLRPVPLRERDELVNYIKKKWDFCYITPLFLKEFVGDTKWLHFELNRSLLMMEEKDDEVTELYKMTGAPTRSFIELCRKIIKNQEQLANVS
ncbi:cytosol aminopeptidase-like [Uloborus diversus]|uniref:cytosol aminopeptidase-like n=1 Tax=Uloborus diversus TaxID=327109 RepID=UPI002409614E|nr:cytosol aminopeptidase-like [Uloborus diversus]